MKELRREGIFQTQSFHSGIANDGVLGSKHREGHRGRVRRRRGDPSQSQN